MKPKTTETLKVIGLFLIVSLLIVILITIGFDNTTSSQAVENYSMNSVINYDNLSLEEMQLAHSIVKSVTPLYQNFKTITFSRDINNICLQDADCSPSNVSNVNHGYRLYDDIVIRWEDKLTMKITVCHEILHGVIKGAGNTYDNDPLHLAIKDLSEKLVCY